MGTVLLVGAGATLAEALPGNPSRAMTPPLDRTFFRLCSYAKFDGLPTVVSYMYDRYGIDPVASNAGMEEVFNYLYADAVGPTPTEETLNSYWALIKMYARAITGTTRDLQGISRSGVGSVLKHLWASGERDLAVVTFNQDLVIENAIEEAVARKAYADMPWSIKDCYETSFDKYWEPPSGRTFSHGGGESIRVLKLHGSLNWVYPARSADDARNSIRQQKGRPGLLLRRRLSLDLRARDGSRRVHLLPLVVPPIYEKSQQLRAQLDSVWARAHLELSRCARLIVFGYSFPSADFAAAALLRRAFVANTSLHELEVIDPDPGVVGRIGAITRAPSIRLYVDTSAFKAANG